ncbi:prolyl oligopeptidase family serine peptidase [Herpetosiphon gulosus]|uniref:Peptidase S9 prolyl oligopeptidase catalytic domain-containing protein n=1 Tax=Herpetosiphon gulosus TaxID=1973496 RepID=A0ABP9XA87_9CHLR
MRRRISLLLALLAILFTTMPASAEIVNVPYFEEPELLLGEDELLKLAQLQDNTYPRVGTTISPDDTTVVIGNYRYSDTGSAFLNVVDGSIVPIQPLQLPEDSDFFPLAATEMVWLDNDNIGQVLYDLFMGGMVLSINRYSGQISLYPVDLPFLPLSIAPNGSRLLVVTFDQLDLEAMRQSPDSVKLPFNIEAPKTTMERVQPKDRIAYYSHTDSRRHMSEETLDLAIFDLTTGELTPLYSVPDHTLLYDYAWSKDGTKFALIRDTVILGEGFGEKRLIDVMTQDALGGLSPKDNPLFTENVLDIFDLTTGNFQPEAWRAVDGDGRVVRDIEWSTDGQRYIVRLERPAQIAGRPNPTYIFPDMASFQFRSIDGTLQRELYAPELQTPEASGFFYLSPDEVLFNAVNGTNQALYYFNQGSGEFRKVSSMDGTYFGVITTNMSRQLIFSYMSFKQPADIYRLNWDGQALSRLTWANAELEKINNIRVDNVSFTVSSGAQRNGFLIQPAGAEFPPKDVPIVMWQEGGPRATMTQFFASNTENPYNLLPNFGIAVLYVPLPGRLGFGPEFLNALADNDNFGKIDIDEGAEIIGQAISRGWTSQGKVGVTGCSYGGYFSAQSITRHPTRYAAANPQCTLLNNANEFHFGLGPLIAYLEGGTPMDKPAEYAADSPLNRADRVRTPTLLFHGEYDFLPVKYAVDFHDQIEIQKHRVKLVTFELEGHGLGDPANQYRAAQEQILWFRQYLSGSPSVAAEPVVTDAATMTVPETTDVIVFEQTTTFAAPSLQFAKNLITAE